MGNYANGGQQWLAVKHPQRVKGHDFPSPEVPRAFPYGIFDLRRNTGYVSMGIDHDTGAFAVASIRGWWRSPLKAELSIQSPEPAHHYRWRGQQWLAVATLEIGVAEFCR